MKVSFLLLHNLAFHLKILYFLFIFLGVFLQDVRYDLRIVLEDCLAKEVVVVVLDLMFSCLDGLAVVFESMGVF